MQLTMLKCKLHRAYVTQVELEYEGSCAIDEKLMHVAGISEYEQVHIYNVTNGERFTTYAIVAPSNSGIISINGAAAHKARIDDCIIICAYAIVNEVEANTWEPRLVYLNKRNQILRTTHNIQVQQDLQYP